MGNTLSLVDYYKDFIIRNNYEERKGIEETLSHLENGHNVILKAPTGYGKTTLTGILANAVTKGIDLGNRVIHVLPYRAIVQDLYLKLVGLAKNKKIFTNNIGAQDMEYHESPFFMKKVNITTLDSFVLNLFKLPIYNLGHFLRNYENYGSHYEFPRALIYSSIVIFDEFHLLGEDGKSLTAGLASLEVLEKAGVPIVVMSATIDEGLEKRLLKSLDNNTKVVNATDFKLKREIEVRILSSHKEALNLAENKVKEGKRVLLVYNTRGNYNSIGETNAISAYKNLKSRGPNPLLIHSKFNRIDRTKKVEKVLSKDAKIVISTQVIEAGIDTSFDVLITEAAPSHNLIQRTGRVARYGGKGEVYIFPFTGKVYDEKEVNITMEKIKEINGIDERLLFEREYESKVDNILLHDLSLLETSVFANSRTVMKLYNQVCSITRDASLILGFPPGTDRSDMAIPLSETEAIKILQIDGKSALVCDNDCNNLKLDLVNCLQLEMLKYDIKGVRIKGYDDELGGVY